MILSDDEFIKKIDPTIFNIINSYYSGGNTLDAREDCINRVLAQQIREKLIWRKNREKNPIDFSKNWVSYCQSVARSMCKEYFLDEKKKRKDEREMLTEIKHRMGHRDNKRRLRVYHDRKMNCPERDDDELNLFDHDDDATSVYANDTSTVSADSDINQLVAITIAQILTDDVLKTLTKQQLEILFMYDGLEMRNKDIANKMGKSTSHVSIQYKRAKEKIKKDKKNPELKKFIKKILIDTRLIHKGWR